MSKRPIMWRLVFAVAGAALALTAAPAFADDILSKAVNDPSTGWAVYGALAKSELVQDKTVTGSTAERVTLSAKGANPWDAGGASAIIKPVGKGDVLLLAFWAKATQPPAGSDAITIVAKIQETAAPYGALSTDLSLRIGTQWKLYYVTGTAAKDYPPNTIAGALQLATAEQVIDFGPIFVLNFGPGYDLTKLPRN